jgi:predicted metal-binding membrane protein
MMPPLVAQPVSHVWQSSFRARRARAAALFGLSYAAMWVAAGLALVPAAIVLMAVLPGAPALLAALLMVLLWSASPPAQAARNRCHRVRRIGAFGRAADLDCLAQGVVTGRDCIAACWPWMILPMTAGIMHVAAMLAVTLVLFAERLSPAGPVRWRIPPAWEAVAALRRS